jgi:hypothetical protein
VPADKQRAAGHVAAVISADTLLALEAYQNRFRRAPRGGHR